MDAVYRYNPVLTAGTPGHPYRRSSFLHIAVYYPPTNKIYVFGGHCKHLTGDNFNNTQIYDIASNTWSAGANMPDVGSFMAGGYVPSTVNIYIISGYNTAFIDSAQDRTWAYDPVANSWTDLTASVSFPHPAGGFAYGVINNKVYLSGGVDANGANIRLTWEFDPSGPSLHAKGQQAGISAKSNRVALSHSTRSSPSVAATPFPPLKVLRPSLYLVRKRQPLARLGRRRAGTTPQLARTRSRLS